MEWINFFLRLGFIPLPDLFVSSDAAGAVGFSAFWNKHWFASSWSFLLETPSIAFCELLSVSDVAIDSAGVLHLHIKSSKTDPFRKGITLHIGPFGHSICAVVACVQPEYTR